MLQGAHKVPQCTVIPISAIYLLIVPDCPWNQWFKDDGVAIIDNGDGGTGGDDENDDYIMQALMNDDVNLDEEEIAKLLDEAPEVAE